MSIRILLVDDHLMMRQGLRILMEHEEGLQVVAEAGDGTEAMAALERQPVDVVVMDVMLPGLNGIDLTRRILDKHPQVRVVGLSIHTSRRMVTEMLRAGARGYVFKLAAFEEVSRAIRTVHKGGRYLSPGAADAVVEELIEQPADSLTFSGITPREREVLQLLAEGESAKEIAYRLGISPKTVDVHRKNLMDKLNLDSVADLTRFAIREGLVSPER